MKLTKQDINRLTIDAPTDELEHLTPYGEFIEMDTKDQIYANVEKECRSVLKEQALETAQEIYRLRDEMPVAILFWETLPLALAKYFALPKPQKTHRGWVMWTDRQCQTLEPS